MSMIWLSKFKNPIEKVEEVLKNNVSRLNK